MIKKKSDLPVDNHDLHMISYVGFINNEVEKNDVYFYILSQTIKYFEEIEDYEKCTDLLNVQNGTFSRDNK